MNPTYFYACSDYPGLEDCPAGFRTASKDELWKVIELHASVAHGENPASWADEDRSQIENLIRVENGSS